MPGKNLQLLICHRITISDLLQFYAWSGNSARELSMYFNVETIVRGYQSVWVIVDKTCPNSDNPFAVALMKVSRLYVMKHFCTLLNVTMRKFLEEEFFCRWKYLPCKHFLLYGIALWCHGFMAIMQHRMIFSLPWLDSGWQQYYRSCGRNSQAFSLYSCVLKKQ